MCENPKTISAASLREARRRKILENSAHRLKLIEGLTSSPTETSNKSFSELRREPEPRKTLITTKPIPELNSNFNEIFKSKELSEISDFLLKDSGKVKTDEVGVEEEEEEVYTEGETSIGSTFLKVFFQKRLHYVLLAVVINIMFYFNAGYWFYENVFCPFYTVKILEFISRKEDRQAFPPVMYLLVVGLPESAQKFIKIVLSLLITLFSDLCLYLFTFIIGAKIINSQQ